MDVESLKKSGSPRLRCLDVFLVVSVVFLFSAVTALAVGGLILGTRLQSDVVQMLRPSPMHDKIQARTQPDDVYKMQNVAYLQAKTNTLTTGTMKWSVVPYGEGNSVGSLYVFDPVQHIITPTRGGHYFVYVDLKLACTNGCDPGHFEVIVGKVLNCTVDLPRSEEQTPLTRQCWQVCTMDETTRLATEMVVPTGLENWQMVSFTLGIFRVD